MNSVIDEPFPFNTSHFLNYFNLFTKREAMPAPILPLQRSRPSYYLSPSREKRNAILLAFEND